MKKFNHKQKTNILAAITLAVFFIGVTFILHWAHTNNALSGVIGFVLAVVPVLLMIVDRNMDDVTERILQLLIK